VSFELIFWIAFGVIVLTWGWRFFRSGSLTGALLGGRIETEFGEIELSSSSFQSQKLKVFTIRSSSGERNVGIALVSKAPLGASLMPIKLTHTQARELEVMLSRASAETTGSGNPQWPTAG
jgi:hypothetical protein